MSKHHDRLAAMLRKAGDAAASEAEAASCIDMAMEYAKRHGISLDDIKNRTEEAENYIHSKFNFSHHDPAHRHLVDRFLTKHICEFCCVIGYFQHAPEGYSAIKFYGHEADVELAMFIRSTCKKAMDGCWEAYKIGLQFSGRKVRDWGAEKLSFCEGMAERLAERMIKIRYKTTGTELVIAKEAKLREKWAENGLNLRRLSHGRNYATSGGASAAGRVAGDTVDIGRPAGNGPMLRIGK